MQSNLDVILLAVSAFSGVVLVFVGFVLDGVLKEQKEFKSKIDKLESKTKSIEHFHSIDKSNIHKRISKIESSISNKDEFPELNKIEKATKEL